MDGNRVDRILVQPARREGGDSPLTRGPHHSGEPAWEVHRRSCRSWPP